MKFLDVRDETRPREIAEFRTPINMHANCPMDRLGNRMGTHDMSIYPCRPHLQRHEEGGFWVVDYLRRPPPQGGGLVCAAGKERLRARTGHADDVWVMEDGTVFGSSSDQGAGGLWALRYRPGFTGSVRWNADESDVIVTSKGHGTQAS